MIDIVIATRNAHKVRELQRLLRTPGVRWRSLAAYPHIRMVPERGATFSANAVMKARAVARRTGQWALADDSGLEVAALGGAPGLRSARFAGRHGDDTANNRKLLRVLRHVLAVAEGQWRGVIAAQPRGRGGFGYDPLFYVPALRKTVAEIPLTVKNRLSHRAQAAARMRRQLPRLVTGAANRTTAVRRLAASGPAPGRR